MDLTTVPRRVDPRVPVRHGEGDKHRLGSIGGLAALSLDALSSVAYGPEAIVLVLVAAGTSALGIGEVPGRPHPSTGLVIVPVGGINKVTEYALAAALSMGGEVLAVSVHLDADLACRFQEEWEQWDPGVRLEVLQSPHRSLVHPILDYILELQEGDRQIAVLIPEVEPRARRYRILQNQRGLLLATILRSRTDVLVCTLPYRLKSR
ncbi:MAG TPA: hypothetical protein VGX23_03560 [Actinocrinis sp.]|nr:hypothetical protein [Actinocrinis sp.]